MVEEVSWMNVSYTAGSRGNKTHFLFSVNKTRFFYMTLDTHYNAAGLFFFSLLSYLSSLFRLCCLAMNFQKGKLKISSQTNSYGLYFNLSCWVEDKTKQNQKEKKCFFQDQCFSVWPPCRFPSPSSKACGVGHCWQEGAAADRWLVWCNMAVPMIPSDVVKKRAGALALTNRILLK